MLMQTLRVEKKLCANRKKLKISMQLGRVQCSSGSATHTKSHADSLFFFSLHNFFSTSIFFPLNTSLYHLTTHILVEFFVFFLYHGSMGAHDTFSYVDFYYTFHRLQIWIWKRALTFRSELFLFFV